MKYQVGVDIGGYIFDASAQTVELTGLSPVAIEDILLITNVFSNQIIYLFDNPLYAGTISGNIISLVYDTTAMNDTDGLQIWISYPYQTENVIVTVGALPANAAQETGGNLAAIKAKTDNIPPLGQALAAASAPVVLTVAQLATLTPLPAITGFATETTLGTRLSESDFDVKAGSLTETAPASDTASSGLNGRLQRIAQRITSLIALLPTSLGQKTMANSLAVVLASDQVAIPITGTISVSSGSTGAQTSTGASVTSVTILAANANRIGAHVYNDSASIGYVKYGSTASATSFFEKLYPEESFDVNNYTGIITMVWVTAVGSARVTEITA